MSRIFLSHSSADNIAAKAFKQWLGGEGWADEDVFLDVDDIGAGERWKEALRKANLRCEAVVLLASPEALSSPECLAEVRKAEDYGKEIIVVLLRDLQLSDRRLDAFKDRQIVDLTHAPQDHKETVSYRGQLHEIHFSREALSKVREYLFRRGVTAEHFAWPPQDRPNADPFPGLSAFGEADAGIFFGRDADILRGLNKLRAMRRIGRPRLLVIQAASGSGKSSYLRAGLWPRLSRDMDFASLAILRPAKGILTGPEGLVRKLALRLSRPVDPVNPGDVRRQLLAESESEATAHFVGYMEAVAAQALEQRRIGDGTASAPAVLLAVDQAEELLRPDDGTESKRFISLIGSLLDKPASDVDLIVIMAVRADKAVELLQAIADRKLELPETLPLLPMPRTSFRDIVAKPLQILARRGQKLSFTPELTDRLVDDAKGTDALPLLAFTLSHLYQEFSAGGVITLDHYEDIGGVSGSIQLALRQALSRPGDAPAIPADSEAQHTLLRAAFVPWLARIDPSSGAPLRRVALIDEIPVEARPMVERLIAARLLVADQREGSVIVEIAHESLLRQWPDLTGWLVEDAAALKAVEEVEHGAKEWVKQHRHQDWLEHRGSRLREAEEVARRPDFHKRLEGEGLEYLRACRTAESRRKLRFAAITGSLVTLLLTGAMLWQFEQELRKTIYWLTSVRGHVLTAEAEAALAKGDVFRECVDCPEMVVVPAGTFTMGSPEGWGDKTGREYPAHDVTIATPFAVAKFEVTFAQFDACAGFDSCDSQIRSNSHDQKPAVNVTWGDAQRYVAWLAETTGKPYRLLTEAEFEYATRGGTQTQYPWGDVFGEGTAHCGGCGSAWRTGTAPVGQFPANQFGLHDMVGNVYEWVEDCSHDDYTGNPPVDGSAWTAERCAQRVIRGGSWLTRPPLLRSAWRDWLAITRRKDDVGFRVARPLTRY